MTGVVDYPPDGVELFRSTDGCSLCFYPTNEKPALLHIAFVAESRAQVDAFHRAAHEDDSVEEVIEFAETCGADCEAAEEEPRVEVIEV